MFGLAEWILRSTIKRTLGLNEGRSFLYGAAPLRKEVRDYFASLDIPLFNLYGLSETTGAATIQYHTKFSLDSCGYTTLGTLMEIRDPDKEGEGEICMRGRHIMMGYLNNEKATKEAIDANGWFRSGDVGKFDGEELKITGRIKELIITAGGENIAPVPIEDNFKNMCQACSNIMLVGENERFIGALITFKVHMDTATFLPTNNLLDEAISYFKQQGIEVTKADEACKDPKVLEHI